ncbi:hypothetical protein OG883_39300 [Streptomyces sp. NBC_01142]|uniref:hypothetical protein n=1 Tax=Streptomyces sp. NBC_01142 TaxID=2975865 RepID=UPI0022513CCB|nr:hypothetical protein [Streptomyces sp. NBC_01142]MCX4825781.1 hypothetical protein [Streptomyces sp. NBC_01142]
MSAELNVIGASAGGQGHALAPFSTMGLIFDGGRLTDVQIQGIVLHPAEHDDVRALHFEGWEPLRPPRDFACLQAVMEARRTGAALYFDTWDRGQE